MDELNSTHPTTPGNSRKIYLGKNKFAIVDESDFTWLIKFHWQAKKSKACWYAIRKFTKAGKTHYIRMHREMTNAPQGMDVHHKNLNSLDNRRSNLIVCSPILHKILHERTLYDRKNRTNSSKKKGDTPNKISTICTI